VPRAIERIWESIEASRGSLEWHVTLTYVELYNDGFRDLLASSSQPGQKILPFEAEAIRKEQSAIIMREIKGPRGCAPTTYLEGSSTFRTPVHSVEELRELIAYGSAARAVGSTSLNERSSRSHAVITINLDSRPLGDSAPATWRTGKVG
jgi:hypothetical protein